MKLSKFFSALILVAIMFCSVAYASPDVGKHVYSKTLCNISKAVSQNIVTATPGSIHSPFVASALVFEVEIGNGIFLLPVAGKAISEIKLYELPLNKGSPIIN